MEQILNNITRNHFLYLNSFIENICLSKSFSDILFIKMIKHIKKYN